MPFWLPNGTTLLHLIEAEVQRQLRKRGYEEIKTPQVLDVELWHRSGHWDNYRENMFFTESGDRQYAIRPMNCPGACLVFGSERHSYRELPLRLAEFGQVSRARARGRPPRPAAGARLHPGRRPHLLHPGADRRRGDRRSARRSTSSTSGSGSTTSGSSSRPGRRSRSAPPSSGSRPKRRCAARSRPRAASTSSTPATAPSTGRRSTSTSPTRSAAPGSAGPARSTSSCRSASTSPTPTPTTSSAGR